MPFPSEVEKLASHFDVYVEELHDFLRTSRIPHGSPRDLIPFADSVSTPGYLHDEVAALVRSFLFREGGAVPRTELVELIIAAVGGPNVDSSAQELLGPVRQILAFVSNVVHSRWGIPRDDEELVSEPMAAPAAPKPIEDSQPLPLVTDRARFHPDADAPSQLPTRTPRGPSETFFRARTLRVEPELSAPPAEEAISPPAVRNVDPQSSPTQPVREEVRPASAARVPFQSESTFSLAPPFPAQLEPDNTILPRQLPLDSISTLESAPPLRVARPDRDQPPAPSSRPDHLTADLPFPSETSKTPADIRVPFASTLPDEDADNSPRRTSWLITIGTILLLALLALLARIVILSIHSSRSAATPLSSNTAAPVINNAYAINPAASYVKPSSYGEPLPRAHNNSAAPVAVPKSINDLRTESAAPLPRPTPGWFPVPSSVMSANLMSAPEPDYPRLARMAHIEGQVVLKVLISKNGNVIAAHVLSGHHLLRAAATHSVYQRHYRPYRLNGKPMQVSTIVFVDFNLS